MVGLCTNQWGVALVQEDHNTVCSIHYCCVVVSSYLSIFCLQKEALSTVLACDKDLVWSWHRHEDQPEISFLGLLGTNYSNAHK